MPEDAKMYLGIKRALDAGIALIGCIVLLPLFLILVALVKLDSPGPALFTQKRVGRDKRLFLLYKFRTMRVDTPHDLATHLLGDNSAYVTGVGKFLRRFSLDELPQLWNILIGDMALVGPRPALFNQYDLIAERDKYVGRYAKTPNGLRPGLTGWAQINGRDELSIPVKARLDGEYAARIGFAFDVRCLVGTLNAVTKGTGR